MPGSSIQLKHHGHGLADYPAGSTFGPRTLVDFEFVWLVDGDARYESDDRTFAAPTGSVVLCRPDTRDGFVWDPKRRTRHGFFHFSIIDPGDLPVIETWPWVLDEPGIVLPLLRHAFWLTSQEGAESQHLATLALALQAFANQRCHVARSSPGAHDHPIIARLFSLLQERWQGERWQAIGIDELAATLGITRTHLGRILKRELDVSPQELLRLLRLDRAASLLARSNLPVQAIAEQCGFESPFHFSRRFKEEYSESPRAFRQGIAEGGRKPTIRVVQVRRLATQMWQ